MLFQHCLNAFIAEEKKDGERKETYVRHPRSNYRRLDRNTSDQFKPGNAKFLHANNLDSRIRFARTVLSHALPVIEQIDGRREKMLFVTLVPVEFAMPLTTAHTFEPKALSAWIRSTMGRANYIGMIEPGFYPRYRWGPDDPRGAISWHAHMLVWGKTKRELLEKFAPLHDSKSLLQSNRAYHVKQITASDAPRCALYALKSPRKQYVSWTSNVPHIDLLTGEVFDVDKQRSAKLRTGQIIQMCEVLRDQYLDKLLVFGGMALLSPEPQLQKLHLINDRKRVGLGQ